MRALITIINREFFFKMKHSYTSYFQRVIISFLFILLSGIPFINTRKSAVSFIDSIVHCAYAASKSPSSHFPLIPLVIDYKIEDTANGTLRSGKRGGICNTNDPIHLSVTTDKKCHLMVFCIDSMMVPLPLFHKESLSPELVDKGTHTFGPFHLNKVTGTVILYAVASVDDFNFKDITPALDSTLSLLEKIGSKGLMADLFELRFPPKGKFSSDYTYFEHRH